MEYSIIAYALVATAVVLVTFKVVSRKLREEDEAFREMMRSIQDRVNEEQLDKKDE